MAGEQLAQLLTGVFLAGFQYLHGGHYEAGGAEAALHGGLLHKGLLNVRKLAVRAKQPLEGADMLALGPYGQVNAAVEAFAVYEHVAGAALAYLAALLYGGEVVVVAEHVGQGSPDVYHLFYVLAVYVAVNKLILCHYSSPPARIMDSVMQRLAVSTAICWRKALLARQESRGLMSSRTVRAKASTVSMDTG